MRALVAASGDSYEGLPPLVAGRLLEVESLVQTQVMRKRLKLLAHLPLTGACEGQHWPVNVRLPYSEAGSSQ
jgi:hypothetical protein